MNFHSVNEFNFLLNRLSGNFFPLKVPDRQLTIMEKLYAVGTLLLEVTYFFLSVRGFFILPVVEAIQGGTVNIAVLTEILVLTFYINYHREQYGLLIESVNQLIGQSDVLGNMIKQFLNPVMRVLKFYTMAAVGSVVIWICMPLVKVLEKDIFSISDFPVPIYFFTQSKEFRIEVFSVGIFFEALASGYAILKKVSIDVYVIHFINLLTTQYIYLKEEFANIFQDNFKSEDLIRKTFDELILHHQSVIRIASKLMKLLAINAMMTYCTCIVRFCFLGFMLITISGQYFEKLLIVMYSCGSLFEVYVLCWGVQKLLDESTSVPDKAFHKSWYNRTCSTRRKYFLLIMTRKIECRVSVFGIVDLTLPSFMTILKQAYSACLLLLRIQ